MTTVLGKQWYIAQFDDRGTTIIVHVNELQDSMKNESHLGQQRNSITTKQNPQLHLREWTKTALFQLTVSQGKAASQY